MDLDSVLPMLMLGGGMGGSAILIYLLWQMMNNSESNTSTNAQVTQQQSSADSSRMSNGYYTAPDPVTGKDAIYKEGVLGPVGTVGEYHVLTEYDLMTEESKEVFEKDLNARNEQETIKQETELQKADNEAGWRMALEYGAAGAGIGAIAGTVVPGIGNAVGAIGGALIGGAIGLGAAAIAESNDGDIWPFW